MIMNKLIFQNFNSHSNKLSMIKKIQVFQEILLTLHCKIKVMGFPLQKVYLKKLLLCLLL